MYNCLFDDVNLNIKVKPKGFIHKNEDYYGYYLKLIVLKKDILPLMKQGVVPRYEVDDFILPIELTKQTLLTINGIKVNNFDDTRLEKLNNYNPQLKYIYLKRHSKKSRKKNSNLNSDYYAVKVRFTIPHNIRKVRTPWV